jgi:cytochrome c biogenesis factor
MDHHCPWVANCIGFYNYKYFINMILYTALCCIFIVATSFPVIETVLSNSDLDYGIAYFIVTSYILSCTLAFVLSCFTAFHFWLISKSYSTIEYCEKKSENDEMFKVSPYN